LGGLPGPAFLEHGEQYVAYQSVEWSFAGLIVAGRRQHLVEHRRAGWGAIVDRLERRRSPRAAVSAAEDARWFVNAAVLLAEHERAMLAATPAGRVGRVDAIAPALVFLASPTAGYVHGASLLVDGGWAAA
jgi:hypothetical protein